MNPARFGAYGYANPTHREAAALMAAVRHATHRFTTAWRSSMPVESLMEYQRIWIDGLNGGDVSAADASYAPDCIVHITGVAEPIRGVGPWKEFMAGFLRAFPDLHFTMEDQVVEGDRVAFRWRATGTHTGPLGAAPPTGKSVVIDGLAMDRVAGGKILERWEQWDQPRMLQQLGFA